MKRDQVSIRARGTERPRLIADLYGDDSTDGGVGGWEAEQAGKRRRPALRYSGRPGHQLTVTLMIHSGFTNKPVEAKCRQLAAWGRPPVRRGKKKAGARIPPRLEVLGPYLRSPRGVSWVIDSIEWGEQVRRGDGRRIQQLVTVTFVEWNKPPPPPKKKKKKDKKKKDKP